VETRQLLSPLREKVSLYLAGERKFCWSDFKSGLAAKEVTKNKHYVRSHLEGNDLEARNHLEVTQISGRNPVAKLQRCNPDQQVCESHAQTLRCALAIDLPSSECD
jgi:hypothetical protein